MDHSFMEETVKKYITSLLTSAPVAVRMYQLEKDYRNTIGESIPYHKLGYNSLEHFLRSIPETVVIRGLGSQAEVVPVITEKSAHINQLVAKQKVNSKSKRGPSMPRKFVLQTQPNINKRIHYPTRRTEHPLTSEPVYVQAESSGTSYPVSECIFVNRLNENNPIIEKGLIPENKLTFNFKPLINDETVKSVKCSNIEKAMLEANKFTNKPNNANDRALNAVSQVKILRERLSKEKQTDTSDCVKANGVSEDYTNQKDMSNNAMKDIFKFDTTQDFNVDVSRKKVSNIYSPVENTNVPYYIQKNLRKLMSYHPDGVWCAELPSIYRSMFNRDLNYQDYGFRSLIELCTSLTSLFHYARPSREDFRLYDRSKPLPEHAEKKFTVASYSADEDSDCNNALPSIDWDDVLKFLPKNIFKPGADIPRVFVPEKTEEDDLFDIVPGEIYDISKFWVFLNNRVLDNLMDELQDFYRVNQHEYHMAEHLIREGMYCVQIVYGEYHRALIVDILPEVEDTIRLLYIDYGTMAKASTKGLCFLHEKFSKVPAQAIRCRLANIVPPLEGAPWSKESSKCFRKLISERTLQARIIKVNQKDQYLDIFMVDVTNPEEKFYINDRLVQEGHAQYPDQERKKCKVDSIHKCKVKQIHLFPTFKELELGFAPSTIEMGIYDECYLSINFAFPQYFETDCQSERERITTTENCYQQKQKNKRKVQSYFYDVSQLRPKPINLKYFETFADELVDLVQNDNLYEDLSHDEGEEIEHLDNKCVEKLPQLEMKEFAEKLKKDCLLARDIMNDLERICEGDTSKNLQEELNFDPSQGFWSLNENSDEFYSYPKDYLSDITAEESFSDKEDFSIRRIANSSDNSDLIDLDYATEYLNFTRSTSCNLTCDMISKENKLNQNKSTNESITSETSENISKSTNPFIESSYDSSSNLQPFNENIVINPNNPFLTYTTEKAIDESSSSTVYGTVTEELEVQRWSAEDGRSNNISSSDTISSESGSTGSIFVAEVTSACAVATQAVVQNLKTDDATGITQSCQNPAWQSHYSYPQNWPPGYSNYYGYGSYPTQPIMYNQYQAYNYPMYPDSVYHPGPHFPTGSHYPPGLPYTLGHVAPVSQLPEQRASTQLRPPPGFSVNSNVYKVSRMLQTTLSSNVITEDNNATDFYDFYNSKLKLALEDAKKEKY